MHATYERDPLTRITDQDIDNVFTEAYENGLEIAPTGRVADYIPELAKADGSSFGICAMNEHGESIDYGDVTTRFSIQSISKVINLAVALKFFGLRHVCRYMKMEPSGDAFNSILKLDTVSNLPFNPFINAGAIQVVSLLQNEFDFDYMLDFTRKFCIDDEITLNRAVYESEAATGDRNRAIAYLLKSKGVLQGDPEKTTDLYFKMCSLNVTARSLAGMGMVLANDGLNPITGQHFIHPGYVRTIKSVMFTCGMYDSSGEFGVKVGMPAKSGVGGGIVCATKSRIGIGMYGPALDEHGNSVAGTHALEHISHRLHQHVFDYTESKYVPSEA